MTVQSCSIHQYIPSLPLPCPFVIPLVVTSISSLWGQCSHASCNIIHWVGNWLPMVQLSKETFKVCLSDVSMGYASFYELWSLAIPNLKSLYSRTVSGMISNMYCRVYFRGGHGGAFTPPPLAIGFPYNYLIWSCPPWICICPPPSPLNSATRHLPPLEWNPEINTV